MLRFNGLCTSRLLFHYGELAAISERFLDRLDLVWLFANSFWLEQNSDQNACDTVMFSPSPSSKFYLANATAGSRCKLKRMMHGSTSFDFC